MRFRAWIILAGAWLVPGLALADEDPLVQFIRSDSDLRILSGGRLLARYVTHDDAILRPYFTQVHALDGMEVTRRHPPRAGIDATDHETMHPGIWIAFGDLGGADFWRNKARIVHEGFEGDPIEGPNRGSFVVRNRYEADGRTVCTETLAVTVVTWEDRFYLLLNSTFVAGDRGFAFGDQEEMGLGVRVATPLAVANGGRILNSAGQRNEAECWGKTALWADYGGVIDGRHAGIVLMPHPGNFRPSWFHARDYGFIAANPFGRAAFTGGEPSRVEVAPGTEFRLAFGVCVYSRDAGIGPDANEAYAEYLDWINWPAQASEAKESNGE